MVLSSASLAMIIAVTALVTFFTRAVPFLFFAHADRPPEAILYLGKVLPPAIMAMLLVFCLRTVPIVTAPHGLPEAAALTTVIAVHVWKRNTLLSIGAGTALYMILVQAIFK